MVQSPFRPKHSKAIFSLNFKYNYSGEVYRSRCYLDLRGVLLVASREFLHSHVEIRVGYRQSSLTLTSAYRPWWFGVVRFLLCQFLGRLSRSVALQIVGVDVKP
jgi:hypothetical protein